MLSKMLELKKSKNRTFQVLFLRNDPSQEVEVQEGIEVDFYDIQRHLENGESVFITSKNTQKIRISEPKSKVNRQLKTRILTSFSFGPG
jgi:hypothetical protein